VQRRPEKAPARPPGEGSDAELVALSVCQAAMGIPSDRQFLGLVGYRLRCRGAGSMHVTQA